MLPYPERFTAHLERVHMIRATGVALPARWFEVEAQLRAFSELRSTAAQRFAEQIVNPQQGVDVLALRAHAIAEESQTFGGQAEVQGAVIAAVEREMLAAWKPEAMNVYRAVAKLYDEAAQQFTTAANTCDPESSAEYMIDASDDQRQAWKLAEVSAARLTQLVPGLISSAQLTETVRLDSADERLAQPWWSAPIDPTAELPLICDPGTLHRRRVWDAFDHVGVGRTGKWGRLVSLGCTLRAHDLDGFQKYRLPKPLIHENRQVLGALRGVIEPITTDPEDAEYRSQIEPITPLRESGAFA
jgi:hypothetical protein